MKLTRFIVNLMQLVFVYIILCVVTFSTYTFIAYQADDESARFTITNKEDRVWMLDNYAYWATDISNSVTSTSLPQPKLRLSVMFEWNWWRNSMSKVDMYFVNPVVAVFNPITRPIACADEIKTYYQKDIGDFADYINRSNNTVTEFESLALTYYDVVIETKTITEENGKQKKYIEPETLSAYTDVFNLYYLVDQDADNNGSADIFDVADGYKYFYELLYKLTRYNAINDKYITDENPDGYVYDRWYKKFVIETSDGDRVLATAVYALYTLNIINIILACLYSWANWVVINENKDGTLSPGRSIFSRMSRRKRKKKGNKHKRHDEDDD